MKFEKGDIIKGAKHNGYGVTNGDMYKAVVLDADDERMEIKVLEHKDKSEIGETFPVDNDDSRFIRVEITKQYLLDMPVGTKIITDKKEDNVFIKTGVDQFINYEGDIIYSCDINNDLTLDDIDGSNKIVKVEEPYYTIIYGRDNEVKEMTIAEISEALGYEVKIIKED